MNETVRYLRPPEGSTWPRPAMESDIHDSAAWRAIHAPDTLTRADQLWLASIADAYGYLITNPTRARNVIPKIRAALFTNQPKED